MKCLYLGLAAVAALMFGLWLARDHFAGSWVAEWTPNLATDALGILVTVAVVDRIVQGRERARLKPRVDRAMRDVGGDFRMFVRTVAVDYAQTHARTFRSLPETSLGVLDHWIENLETEDTERPGVRDGTHHPVLLMNALNTAESLKRAAADERDVLEPDVVAKIGEFEESARMGYAIWGGLPEDAEERARIALKEVVLAAHDLGEVLIRHDKQWLEEGEVLFAVPGTWGTEFVRQAAPPHADER
jgi:hypothetical protein